MIWTTVASVSDDVCDSRRLRPRPETRHNILVMLTAACTRFIRHCALLGLTEKHKCNTVCAEKSFAFPAVLGEHLRHIMLAARHAVAHARTCTRRSLSSSSSAFGGFAPFDVVCAHGVSDATTSQFLSRGGDAPEAYFLSLFLQVNPATGDVIATIQSGTFVPVSALPSLSPARRLGIPTAQLSSHPVVRRR